MCNHMVAHHDSVTRSIDVPAAPPAGTELFLFAGDAVPTVDAVKIVEGRPVAETWSPGDGTVTRASALMDERVGADGQLLTLLDETSARQGMQQAYDQGIRAVAIVLMHAYRYPAHELRLAELASQVGFAQISCSHQVSP